MSEKAKCELVLLVDCEGEYACGVDYESAKASYESSVVELSENEGGYRVVNVTVGVTKPRAVELVGEAPEVSGKATLAVA